MSTVVLVDRTIAGHHYYYLQTFQKQFQQCGYKVLVCLPEHLQDELKSDLSFQLPVKNKTNLGRWHQLWESLKLWRAVKLSVKRYQQLNNISVDLVFFMMGDDFIHSYFNDSWTNRILPFYVTNVFKLAWAGVFFHPRHVRLPHKYKLWYTLNGKRKSALFKKCRGILCPDEGVIEQLSEEFDAPVMKMPDFSTNEVPDRKPAVIEKIEEKANGRSIICLVGQIHKRKGIHVLKQLIHHRELTKHYFFLIVGRRASEFFDAGEDYTYILDRYIRDEREFNSLIAASNIIYACYTRFPHSSNILAKAALFQKPVLVSKGFLMEERVKKYSLGYAFPELNQEYNLAGFLKEHNPVLPSDADTQAYLADHSITKLKSVLNSL